MPLTDSYPKAVAFITASREQRDGSIAVVPIGTAFILRIPGYEDPGFEYLVTASHIVQGESKTYARFRTRPEPGVVDLPVPGWEHHPKADVSVTRLAPRGGVDRLSILSTDLVGWDRYPVLAPDIGHRVYFIGLLAVNDWMSPRPMVRSGTLGALYEPGVPIGPPMNRRHVEAHLIDCRSYGGFSGSPCFIQAEAFNTLHTESGPKYSIELPTRLLGLISGHFDMWSDTEVQVDEVSEYGGVTVKLNAGVGVVTPAEKILEVLAMPEFADERKADAQKKRARPELSGATYDTLENQSEFDRFEELAKQLANTPKPKDDEEKS